MTMVSRDPFARSELHRSKAVGHGGCDWCGGFRQHKGKTTWLLFKYRTESDGGRVNEHKGVFCSKSCHDAYHG
jgi:hypothetical protein